MSRCTLSVCPRILSQCVYGGRQICCHSRLQTTDIGEIDHIDSIKSLFLFPPCLRIDYRSSTNGLRGLLLSVQMFGPEEPRLCLSLLQQCRVSKEKQQGKIKLGIVELHTTSILGCVLPLQEVALHQSPPTFLSIYRDNDSKGQSLGHVRFIVHSNSSLIPPPYIVSNAACEMGKRYIVGI